ncbi:hypothetical protein GCM10028794_10690 [Silanimonas algicola]
MEKGNDGGPGLRPGPGGVKTALAKEGEPAPQVRASSFRAQSIASKRLAATFLRTLKGSQTRPFIAM